MKNALQFFGLRFNDMHLVDVKTTALGVELHHGGLMVHIGHPEQRATLTLPVRPGHVYRRRDGALAVPVERPDSGSNAWMFVGTGEYVRRTDGQSGSIVPQPFDLVADWPCN